MTDPNSQDSGSAAVAMLWVIGFGVALMGPVAGVAHDAVVAAQVQMVADAAALAGVAGGREVAVEIAQANGAVLTEFVRSISDRGVSIRVTVVDEHHRARAAASDSV